MLYQPKFGYILLKFATSSSVIVCKLILLAIVSEFDSYCVPNPAVFLAHLSNA